MNRGLIIGKFMPLHLGHIALIEFAESQCDELRILVSANLDDPIPGPKRLNWLWQTFRHHKNIHIEYTDESLPDSPVSSRSVSRVWARFLSNRFPDTTLIFSSEEYGEFLAEYMGIKHVMFDLNRNQSPISGTRIRNNPMGNWSFIPPAVQDFYAKKICIYGPESTGKSTLTELLAHHYDSDFVPEMARYVLDQRGVEELVFEDIEKIAETHAGAILEQKNYRYLFCDTDFITTHIYSRHYFNRVPDFPLWVQSANRFDHYLFCDNDVPWVKDIHRNLEHLQSEMRVLFEMELKKQGIAYTVLSGTWEQRFQKAVETIDSL